MCCLSKSGILFVGKGLYWRGGIIGVKIFVYNYVGGKLNKHLSNMGEKDSQEISKKEAEKILLKNKIYNVWKDPVISKLIANWIWYIVPLIATLVFSYFKKEEIYCAFITLIFLDIKLYVLVILLVLSLIARKIYFKIYSKRKKEREYFISQRVGEYRLGDLNNILLTTYITLPRHFQGILGLEELDLLTCFRMFISRMNTGIGFDHPTEEGEFIYYKLGPALMSYDLCEKVPSLDNNTAGNINSYDIQTSKNGLKFFALIESFERSNNVKKYEEEIAERNSKIAEVLNRS